MSTSSPPVQYVEQNMGLKVLYTFDDDHTTPFLSRSKTLHKVRVFPEKLGTAELVSVLSVVKLSSPEIFTSGADYNVYVRDVSEVDEPFVGQGLLSTLTAGAVAGRVCTNFASALLNNTSAETLEVKLRFARFVNHRTGGNTASGGASSTSASRITAMPASRTASAAVLSMNTNQDMNENHTEFRDTLSSLPISRVQAPSKKRKRVTNPSPAPKAMRTRSLPVHAMPLQSGIAQKIMQQDRLEKDFKFLNSAGGPIYNDSSPRKRFSKDFLANKDTKCIKCTSKKAKPGRALCGSCELGPGSEDTVCDWGKENVPPTGVFRHDRRSSVQSKPSGTPVDALEFTGTNLQEQLQNCENEDISKQLEEELSWFNELFEDITPRIDEDATSMAPMPTSPTTMGSSGVPKRTMPSSPTSMFIDEVNSM